MCTFPMQYESLRLNSTTVEAEFNVTVTSSEDMQRLCRIVAYYYFVEAIDNDSNIYYYMKQNAMNALAYWVSFTSCFLLVYIHIGIFIQPFQADTLLATCRIARTALMNVLEFGHKCQRAVLRSLIHESVNNGDNICECDWLEHLIRKQDLGGKCSQLAEGPFQSC